MKKIICSLLAVLLLVTMLSGCSSTKVGSVNGVSFDADTYNFYVTQIEKQLGVNTYGEGWETVELEGKKLVDIVREEAITELAISIIVRQKAKENGLEITQLDKDKLESQITSMKNSIGSDADYELWLLEQGLTEKVYREFIEYSLLSSKLVEKLIPDVSEEDLLKYYNENVAHVKHILVKTVDDDMNSVSGDEFAKKQALAYDYLKRAKAGEDFDKMVNDLSEDPGSQSEPEGYYLGKGFILGTTGGMLTEFETASLALKVGEISDPVETIYGYHIIKRYENDREAFDTHYEQLQANIKSVKYSAMLDQWRSEAKVEINEDVIESL
ncbi:MAG: peptidylprolyl isomerase [Clostridia bacterium]|nr:peptidylprolyl isomerase [Clostridia bacterium]